MTELELPVDRSERWQAAACYLFSLPLAAWSTIWLFRGYDTASKTEIALMAAWPGLVLLLHLFFYWDAGSFRRYVVARLSAFTRSRFLRVENGRVLYGFRLFGRNFTELEASLDGVASLEWRSFTYSSEANSLESGWHVQLSLSSRWILHSIESHRNEQIVRLSLGRLGSEQEVGSLAREIRQMLADGGMDLDKQDGREFRRSSYSGMKW